MVVDREMAWPTMGNVSGRRPASEESTEQSRLSIALIGSFHFLSGLLFNFLQ